jgi:diaminopimelate decarboxylase
MHSDQPTDHAVSAAGEDLLAVLESAARLQRLVPDAVLVGGSAAAAYAGHRDSHDHDHVLADLRERYDALLEALESEDGWVTNGLVPGEIILGRLGDIETGVRQLIRKVPLETATITLPSGRTLVVPPSTKRSGSRRS